MNVVVKSGLWLRGVVFSVFMMLMLPSYISHAQSTLTPFTSASVDNCVRQAYLIKGSPTSNLYELDLLTGTEILVGNLGLSVNAAGFNEKDGYIYGIHRVTKNLMRIGSGAGEIEVVALPPATVALLAGTTGEFNTGDITSDGQMVILNGDRSLFTIDLDPASPTYLQETSGGGVSITAGFSLSDFAIQRGGNLAYTILSAADSGKFASINITTGVVTVLSPTSVVLGGGEIYGAAYSDTGTNVYFGGNVTGRIYKLDVANPTALGELVTNSSSASDNDGVRCTIIPIEGVEPTKTLQSLTGPDVAGEYTATYEIVLQNSTFIATTYDFREEPRYSPGLNIVSGTVTNVVSSGANVPAGFGAFTSPDWTIVSNQAIDGSANHTYTVEFKIEVTDASAIRDCRNLNGGFGLFNRAETSSDAGELRYRICTQPPQVPLVNVTKVSGALSGPDGAGDYMIPYTITVENSGNGSTTYALTDTPAFSPGVTISTGTATVVSDGANTPATPANYAGAGAWQLAPATQTIAGKETHTYSTIYTFKVVDSSVFVDCDAVPVAGQGLFNAINATGTGVSTGDDNSCPALPDFANVQVSKIAGVLSVPNGAGEYTIEYTVVAENVGGAVGDYDLSDTPSFSPGITIVSGTATVVTDGANTPATPANYAGAPWELAAAGQAINVGEKHTYTTTYTFTVTDASVLVDCDPVTPVAGQGLFNAIATNAAGSSDPTGADCANLPNAADVQVSKTAGALAGPNGADEYTIEYTIVAENVGGTVGDYDLSDTPSFSPGITISTGTATVVSDGVNTPATPANYAGAPWELAAAGQAINVGEKHTYTTTYTFTVTDASVLVDCDPVTPVAGEGLFNAINATGTGVSITVNSSCPNLPGVADVQVSKTAGVPSGPNGGEYTIEYTIVAENVGNGATTYDLEDTPSFSPGITISIGTATVVSDGANTPATPANYAGVPWELAAPGQVIDAGEKHTYTTIYTFTIADASVLVDCDAVTPVAGQGLFNAINATGTGVSVTDNSPCPNLPGVADVSISKTAGVPSGPNGGEYTIEYTIVAENVGNGATTYDLEDTPSFSPGITISIGTATVVSDGANTPATPANYAGVPWELAASGQVIDAGEKHTYTTIYTFTVTDASVLVDCDAVTPVAGQGLFNAINATGTGVSVTDNSPCPNLPGVADVSISKTAGVPSGPNGGEYTIEYTIVAENVGNGATTYDLEDTPSFSPGIAISIGTATVVSDGANTPATPANYAGVPWELAAAGQAIDAGEKHTYTTIYTFTVTDASVLVDCDSAAPVAGEGLFNAINATGTGVSVTGNSPCPNLPGVADVQVSKTADVGALAGPNVAGEYTIEYTIVAENVGNGATTYDLEDTPSFSPGITISTGTATVVSDGANTPATPANYAGVPWELAAPGQAIDAGEKHTYTTIYTFTVTDASVLVECDSAAPVAGEGLFNAINATGTGVSVTGNSPCPNLPGVADVQVSKIAGVPSGPNGGEYTIEYTIVAENVGNGATTYDLEDTPSFSPGITISTGTATVVSDGANTPATPANYAGVPWELAAPGQAIDAGEKHSYTTIYTFTVTDASVLVECDSAAPVAGEGLFNAINATGTGVSVTGNSPCPDLPLVPDVRIVKTEGALVGPDVAGNYTISYTIEASNVGNGATTYDLEDTPSFSPGVTISIGTATVATDGANTPATPANYAGVPWELAAAGQAIDAGEKHSYTTIYTFTVTDASVLVDCDAAAPVAGEGLFNAINATGTGVSVTGNSPCPDLPAVPDVRISKTAGVPSVPNGAGEYTIEYTIEAENVGNGATTYDLEDTPSFSPGITIVTGAATVVSDGANTPATPANYAGAPWVLAPAGQAIDAGEKHTYTTTYTFTIADASVLVECDATTPAPGEGLFNAVATNAAGSTVSASDSCPDLPAVPDVRIAKTEGALVGPDPAGNYTISYTIEADNVGNAATTYDLEDTPSFSPGITIVSGAATVATDGANTPATPANYAGVPWELAAAGQAIDAGEKHTYTTIYTFTIADASLLIECTPGTPAAGEGLFNAVGTNSPGSTVSTSDSCPDLPAVPDVRIVKTAGAVTGPVGSAVGGTYTIVYTIEAENVGNAVGSYDLSDTPSFSPGITIATGTATVVSDGANTPATPANYAGIPWVLTPAGQAIDSKEKHTYTTTYTFTVTDASVLVECTPGTPAAGEGLFNAVATASPGSTFAASESCPELPLVPDVRISKMAGDVTGPVGDFVGGTYTVVYTIEAENVGNGPTTYDLSDTPAFTPGVVIAGGTATVITDGANTPATPAPYTAGDWALTTAQVIDGKEKHTYTTSYTFTVDDASLLVECNGATPTAGEGLFNSVATNAADSTVKDSNSCSELPPVPDVRTSKTFGEITGPDASGVYTVSYSIVSDNVGNAPTIYTVTEKPGFSEGLTVTGATVASVVSTGANTPSGFSDYVEGQDWVILQDQAIDSKETHTYTVEFNFEITDLSLYVDCDPAAPAAGQGLFNTIERDGPEGMADALVCPTLGSPNIDATKTVLNEDVNIVGVGEYEASYEIVVENSGDLAGLYSLADTPGFAKDIRVLGVKLDGKDAVLDTDGNLVIATDQLLAIGEKKTYRVDFTLTNNFLTDASDQTCSGSAGAGLYNAVQLGAFGVEEENAVCFDVPEVGRLVPSLRVEKIASTTEVKRGDRVTWTVTIVNEGGVPTGPALDLVDTMDPGLVYQASTAEVGDTAEEPEQEGVVLRWDLPQLLPGESARISYDTLIGLNLRERVYVNRAQVFEPLTTNTRVPAGGERPVSNEARAEVRLTIEAVFDCPTIVGKVCEDRNGDGYCDSEDGQETSVAVSEVRLVTLNGDIIRTDKFGRYHVPCDVIGAVRQEGSNFSLKLDVRSLSSGYKVRSENPRVIRLTEGKMQKINFAIGLPTRIDVTVDYELFSTGGTVLSAKALSTFRNSLSAFWNKSSDYVVHLTYVKKKGEPESMMRQRLTSLKNALTPFLPHNDQYRFKIIKSRP